MDDADIAQRNQELHIRVAIANVFRPPGESAIYCAECEEAIPDDRRTAIPGCRLCIDCQKELEDVRRKRRRV